MRGGEVLYIFLIEKIKFNEELRQFSIFLCILNPDRITVVLVIALVKFKKRGKSTFILRNSNFQGSKFKCNSKKEDEEPNPGEKFNLFHSPELPALLSPSSSRQ